MRDYEDVIEIRDELEDLASYIQCCIDRAEALRYDDMAEIFEGALSDVNDELRVIEKIIEDFQEEQE